MATNKITMNDEQMDQITGGTILPYRVQPGDSLAEIAKKYNVTVEQLMKWIDAKEFDRNEKVKAVTELYNEIGIRELCEQKIEAYYQESLVYLAKINLPEERKAELKAYAAEMMKRQS